MNQLDNSTEGKAHLVRTKAIAIVNKLTNWLWSTIAISLILIALMISSLKLFINEFNDFKPQIESYLSNRLNREVKIEHLSFEWPSVGPRIQFQNLELKPAAHEKIHSMVIANGAVAIDLWRSLFSFGIITDEINLQGIQIYYHPENNIPIGNNSNTTADVQKVARTKLFRQKIMDWLLQQRTIEIYDSYLQVKSPFKNDFSLALPLFTFHGSYDTHQLKGIAVTNHGKKITIKSQMIGSTDAPDRKIQIYFNAKDINLQDLPIDIIFRKYTKIKGSVALEVWGDIEGSHMQQLIMKASANHLLAGEKKLTFSIPENYLFWNRVHDKNWQFGSTPVSLIINGKKIPEFVIRGERVIDHSSRLKTWSVNGLALPVRLVMGILADQLPGKFQNWYNKANPTGMITEIGTSFSPDEKEPLINLHFNLDHFSMLRVKNIPGATGINAKVVINKQKASFLIDSSNGKLNLKPMFRSPLKFQKLNANLEYEFLPYPKLKWNQFEFQNKDITINSLGKIEYSDDSNGYLEISTQLQNLNTEHTGEFLPVGIMSANTVKYLDGSVGNGTLLNANAVVRGDFNSFPYINGGGIFDVQANLKNTQFKFHQDWPAIEGLGAFLRFHGDSMYISTQQGSVAGVNIQSAVAKIKELSNENNHLLLDIKTQNNGQTTLEMLKKTPISSVAKSLSFLEFPNLDKNEKNNKEDLDTHVKLDIALNGNSPPVIAGSIHLDSNAINIKTPELPLRQLKGEINFSQAGLENSNFHGTLWDEPVRAKISRKKDNSIFEINTSLSETGINALSGLNFNKYISGKTPLNAKITMSPSEGKKHTTTRINISSTLKGLGIHFPDHLVKKPEKSLLWKSQIYLGQNNIVFNSELDSFLKFSASKYQDKPWQGKLASIGKFSDLKIKPSSWQSSMSINQLHIDQWFPIITEVFNIDSGSNQAIPSGMIPDFNIGLSVKNLYAFKKNFGQNQVHLLPSKGFKLQFNGKELQGSVHFTSHNDSPVTATFKRFQIPQEKNSQTPNNKTKAVATLSEESVEAPLSFEPASFPALKFNCDSCKYHGIDLGSIHLKITPGENQTFISGQWQKNKLIDSQFESSWTKKTTRISGNLNSNDFDQLTQIWSISSGIKQSTLKSQFALKWPGSPWDFTLKNLQGKISTKLDKGYIDDVSAQGAQVFSLFSLQNLKRRLTLDFNDVYQKGFFYDSITGSFVIDKGKAYSQGLLINGTAAQISMTGYTDLVNGEFEQHLVVIPKLSSSLPVLAGWAISPPTALIALVFDKLFLKPALDVVTRIDYQITGPWDKPVMKELGKKKKAIRVKESKRENNKSEKKKAITE